MRPPGPLISDQRLSLRLHALANNLANFMCIKALPETALHWLPMTLREPLIKIGAIVVRHRRHVGYQMANAAIPKGSN